MKDGAGILRGPRTIGTVDEGKGVEGVDYWRIGHGMNKRKQITFAATAQTEEEVKKAERGHADGSKPVQVPKRVWRPRV